MELETTVQQCWPIIKLLKYTGLFPCSIAYHHPPKAIELTRSVSPKTHPSFQVDHSWKSFLLRATVQTYFGMRVAFGYIQLFRAAVLQVDYNFSLVVSSLAGSLIGTCALGITIVASRNPQQLALLLNQWQQTETEIGLLILTHSKWKGRQGRSSAYVPVRNVLVLLILWVCGMGTFTAITIPRLMSFLYSLADRSQEYFWFQVISIFDANLYFFLLWTQYAQLDLFGVIFPKWIQTTLETISAQQDPFGESETGLTPLRPLTAFRFYSKLTHLVLSFNAIFGNLLVGMKLAFIISVCILLYAPIRHPAGPAMGFAQLTLALTILVKLIPLLLSMGSVQKESIKFKKAWIHALGNNHASNDGEQNSSKMALFHYLPPISFCGGPFYDIQASTILTFFSITTTYLIVALQF